jgi:hypothetical protein
MRRSYALLAIAVALGLTGMLLVTRQRSRSASPPLVAWKYVPPANGVVGLPPGPPVPAPAGRSLADVPAGSIDFINADLSQVLRVYEVLANAELLVEQGVQLPRALITFSNRQDLTRTEALRIFEGALREQAGLIVDHQDAKHIALRYDKSVRAIK